MRFLLSDVAPSALYYYDVTAYESANLSLFFYEETKNTSSREGRMMFSWLGQSVSFPSALC